MVLLQIGGVLADGRQLVFPQDGGGHRPVGGEFEVGQLRREDRGLAIVGADDHRHGQHHFVILHHCQRVVGDVDPDMPLAKFPTIILAEFLRCFDGNYQFHEDKAYIWVSFGGDESYKIGRASCRERV